MSIGQAIEKIFNRIFGTSVSKKSIKIGKLKAPFIEIEDFEMKSHEED